MQIRLTAPISIESHGGRQLAQPGLQNLARSGQHRDAVPLSLNCGVAKWKGSGLISRLHAGSIPAPATSFLLGRSIIQEVTRPASGRARCKAVAVHHFQDTTKGPTCQRWQAPKHLSSTGEGSEPRKSHTLPHRGAIAAPAACRVRSAPVAIDAVASRVPRPRTISGLVAA